MKVAVTNISLAFTINPLKSNSQDNDRNTPARRARLWSRRYRHDNEDADHAAHLELLEGLSCAVMV